MRAADFEEIVLRQIQRSKDVLIDKAKEYATGEDRLANFKAAAAVQGISVQEALAGMMAKHTYSVYAMCKDGEAHTTAMWDEKITDHINYLLLLRAVIEEAHNSPEKNLMAKKQYEVSGMRGSADNPNQNVEVREVGTANYQWLDINDLMVAKAQIEELSGMYDLGKLLGDHD